MNEYIPENIIAMSPEFREYLHDETKNVGHAESISFPTSEAEICSILSHFNSLGTRVTIQGNRTGIAAAAVPYGGHIMSLDHMCRVKGMRIEDGQVFLRVQPGLALGTLRAMISAQNFDIRGWDDESLEAYAAFKKMPRQYFPPDPTESSASLGGIAACNSSGAKTYHYGPARPYINGLRLALANGDIVALRRGQQFAKARAFSLRTESGAVISGSLPSYTMPSCKNASGYYAADDMDLVDMFIGSDGTLGVITELELRLIPMPKSIWGVNCFFAQIDQSIEFVEKIRGTQGIVALEYFDGHALDILRAYKDGGCPVPEGFGCMIYVEMHTDDDQRSIELLRLIGKVMEECGADSGDTWVARSLPDRERLLVLRHKVPESVNALIALRKRSDPSIAKVGSDMAVPDDKLRDVMELYHRSLAQKGFEFASWGHIGNNHVHVNVLPRSKDDMVGGKEMFMDWAKEVVAMGGTVSAEHGAGKNKAQFLPILYGEKCVREMAAMKRCFDPRCILGVGNMFPPEYVLNDE